MFVVLGTVQAKAQRVEEENYSNFSCAYIGSRVQINWTSPSRSEELGYLIERSSNGIDYQTVAWVAAAGEWTQAMEIGYHWQDPLPLEKYSYYRIKAYSRGTVSRPCMVYNSYSIELEPVSMLEY